MLFRSGSARLRYFGPRPLIEDNSVRSHATTTVNGRLGYRINGSTNINSLTYGGD